MWHLLLLAIAACLSTPLLSTPALAHEIVDATGRPLSLNAALDCILAGAGDRRR